MVIYYHGTNIDVALAIARDGAIMSPYEQELKRLIADEARDGISRRYPGKTLEETALECASSGYAKREVEMRAKRISFTLRQELARSYATSEGLYGGVVLGLEFDKGDQKENVIGQIGISPTVYVPKVELTKLRNLTVYGSEEEIDQIFRAYKKFGVVRQK